MRLVGVVLALALLPGAAEARKVRRAPSVAADYFTQQTPPLAAGQIELVTRSTLPDAVSGGDVLVTVRGLNEGDKLTVKLGRRSLTRMFARDEEGNRTGLVTGLRLGTNRITATAVGRTGRRRATLAVRNHPVSGPVISGPHQRPFICETEQSQLGAPLDADCSIAPRVEWYARGNDGGFTKIDPRGPYPSDTVRTRTRDGRGVPFVVRLETRTINRGITRMAVLDDPVARGGADDPRRTNWDRRVTYLFGESCGVGYHQGRSLPSIVLGVPLSQFSGDTAFATIAGLDQRVAAGDLVIHSTQAAFGVYCNPLVSAETLMLIKEHVVETFGDPEVTLGMGGSGGALQQYNALNNEPGLLDGALPIASFADVLSTAMTVVDCGLLTDYWSRTSLDWSDEAKQAVAGHATTAICADWRALFLSNLDPSEGCAAIVPREIRYDAKKRRDGVRCTLQDSTRNFWGTDGATGFAKRPYDNVGVQYGLGALNAGLITPAQFVDLNREVGGYDLDGKRVPERSAMDEETARTSYRIGGVIGRGALDRAPVIDQATYLDRIPLLDIHDHIRPFQIRERLRRRLRQRGTMRIWRGVSTPADAFGAIDDWLRGLAERRGLGDPDEIVAARPTRAEDRCIVGAGVTLSAPGALTGPANLNVPLGPDAAADALFTLPLHLQFAEGQEADNASACGKAFPAYSGTRMVAGGPLTDDVLKCSLKPVDGSDYKVAVDLAELRRIFPHGVCDWSQPGVGEVERSVIWPSLGGSRLRPLHALRWRAARSIVRR